MVVFYHVKTLNEVNNYQIVAILEVNLVDIKVRGPQTQTKHKPRTNPPTEGENIPVYKHDSWLIRSETVFLMQTMIRKLFHTFTNEKGERNAKDLLIDYLLKSHARLLLRVNMSQLSTSRNNKQWAKIKCGCCSYR